MQERLGAFEGGERPALLLGNGASVAVWDRFSYWSLLEKANLGTRERGLFERLKTSDFEVVLSALKTTSQVADALEEDEAADVARDTLDEVRSGLIRAVQAVHPPYAQVRRVLRRIRRHLATYSNVFTTNYDLLVYWAVMQTVHVDEGPHKRFPDFLWGRGFDPLDADLRDENSQTGIYFLHGALHLHHRDDRGVRKLQADGLNLLDGFARSLRSGESAPLFVSEGTHFDKRRRVNESPYLTFCHTRLSQNDAPLVILGHSLSDQDSHIKEAVLAPGRGPGAPPVAIGVHNPSSDRAQERIYRLQGDLALHGRQVYFFDSTDHPLASESVRCGDTEATLSADLEVEVPPVSMPVSSVLVKVGLVQSPQSRESIVSLLGLREEAALDWLLEVEDMGLLSHDIGRYSLTPSAVSLLRE